MCATGLIVSDIPYNLLTGHEGKQLEDQLYLILDSKESWDYARRQYGNLIAEGYEPRNIWYMLEWATNKLCGRTVCSFTTKASIRGILYNIVKEKCAVGVGGRFTKYGHMATTVGLITEQTDIQAIEKPEDVDMGRVKSIIIDDPYGNYFKGYADHNGNDLLFTPSQFNWVTKSYSNENSKYALFFKNI
jgi:hypothetical protein